MYASAWRLPPNLINFAKMQEHISLNVMKLFCGPASGQPAVCSDISRSRLG